MDFIGASFGEDAPPRARALARRSLDALGMPTTRVRDIARDGTLVDYEYDEWNVSREVKEANAGNGAEGNRKGKGERSGRRMKGANARDARGRGETIMTQNQVRMAAMRLPYGLEYLGVDGPIGHVGRNGTLYASANGEGGGAVVIRRADAGMLGEDDLDFALEAHDVGLDANNCSFDSPDLFSAAFVTPRIGSKYDARNRYASASAQQSKRAKAEERAKRIELKKKLIELQSLVTVLSERVERLAEERDELTLAAQNASAKAHDIDASRKSSAVSRSISQIRQKLGAKPDLSEGFNTLRYRCLLEVVHKQCLASIRQLISHQWGFPFSTPVDPDALDLPTYRDIIKEPMDLGTIKKLIEDGGKYVMSEEVDADVRLTFANAMTFNDEGTDVYNMAQGLAAEWDNKWAAIQQRIAEVEMYVIVERDLALARNVAAACRADLANKDRECANASAALDIALTQLADVENHMLNIMRTLTPDDRDSLAISLRRLPEALREGAREILARQSGEGWTAASVRLENINDHSDLTLHLLIRYAKTMNRNRLAVMSGWCGHNVPEMVLEKFKQEGEDVDVDELVAFANTAPIQNGSAHGLDLRSIDAMRDEYDFDPLAFDALLDDVPDDADMDFDLAL